MSDQPSADPSDPILSDAHLSAAEGYVLADRPLEAPGYTLWLMACWLMIVGLGTMRYLAMREVDTANMATQILGCFNMVLMIVAVVLQLMWVYRLHRDARTWGGYRDISPGLALGLAFIPMLGMLWVAVCMVKLTNWYGRPDLPGPDLSRRAAGTCRVTAVASFLLVPWMAAAVYTQARVWPALMAVRRDNPGATPEELREASQAATQAVSLPETAQLGVTIVQLIALLLFLYALYCLTRDLYARLEATAVEGVAPAGEADVPDEGGDLWPPTEPAD